MLLTIKRYLRNSTNLRKIFRDLRVEKAIRESGKFDQNFYLSMNPDVQSTGKNAIRHYVRHGAIEGRNPNRDFNGHDYLAANPDVKISGMNPFLHFIQFGEREQRPLSPAAPVRLALPSDTKIAIPEPVKQLRSTVYSDLEHSFIDIRPSQKKEIPLTNRVAIFAFFNANGVIYPYVLHYLRNLRAVCDKIVFVADNDMQQSEIAKLNGKVDAVLFGRHHEYDFGSYKKGIAYAKANGLLTHADELLLCNDSCYGPITSFEKLFADMRGSEADFWGLTSNTQYGYHLQSYFILFKRSVFSKLSFFKFFSKVGSHSDVSQVVLNYEVKLTSYFTDLGFECSCYINDEAPEIRDSAEANPNLTVVPIVLMEAGCPLVKVKAFKKTTCNYDGIPRTLRHIYDVNPELHSYIIDHSQPGVYANSEGVKFSIITPFFNRKETIFKAIDSVLGQFHLLYELILIDDGSTDGASEEILARYADEINAGKIRLISSPERNGVSAARNIGLSYSGNPWITYLDSDNTMKPNFLSTFASSIVEHPKHSLFYSCFSLDSDGTLRGRVSYNRAQLLKGNYIDLGTFVHSRALYEKHGGFDTGLKRLVDWDLIIRYTKDLSAVFIPQPLMNYNDSEEDKSRISVRESLDDARIFLRKKHNLPFVVSTVIPAYNHEDYIEQAIVSAISQKGNFIHEILVCDDASTDNTQTIITGLQKKYPGIIRNISNSVNLGISATFRKCFKESSGDFIAILEGDDYWTTTSKLENQLQFLTTNVDCSMVFSMIDVLNIEAKKSRYLKRQQSLSKNRLSGKDFLNDPSMNLIANFSSCMFKSDLMRTLPDRLFDGRFNEIALAFHLERHGSIGFLNTAMGVYRQHPQGVWTGSDKRMQLESAINTRMMVKDVADPKYHDDIEKIIDLKRLELASLS